MRASLGLLLLIAVGCRAPEPDWPGRSRLRPNDLEGAQRRRWLQLLASFAPPASDAQQVEVAALLEALCDPSAEQRDRAYDGLLAEGPRTARLVLNAPPEADPELQFRLRLLEHDLWQVPLPLDVFTPHDLYESPQPLPEGYSLQLSNRKPQSVDLSLSRDGRSLLTWHGHRQTPVLVRDGVLYTADFELLAPGCSVLAYDLDNRVLLWRKDLPGVIRSRRYLAGNSVTLRLETHTVTVLRREQRSERGAAPELRETPELVVQVLDAHSGVLQFHRELLRGRP